MNKSQKVYKVDEYGNKIYDKKTRTYKCERTISINDWDSKENVENWREHWAMECNRIFKQLGIKNEVTHRSYLRQGIGKQPTKHLGSRAYATVKRGKPNKRAEKNREILELNPIKELHERENERSYNISR